jgi:hypothetical protein
MRLRAIRLSRVAWIAAVLVAPLAGGLTSYFISGDVDVRQRGHG